jgi:hypothetical protein
MDRKNKRGEFLPGRVAVIGLGLIVIGLTGCGSETAVTKPAEAVSAPQPTADTTKKTARKSRLLAPNADLGPRERRALKAKGELPE